MSLGTETLARASARRPWRTVSIWLVLLVAAGIVSSQLLAGALTTTIGFTDEPESVIAMNLAEELRGEAPDTEFVVVTSETANVEDPEYVAYVTELQTEIAALGPDVIISVGSYLDETGPVSESGRSALLPVVIAGDDVDVIGDHAELLKEAVAVVVSSRWLPGLDRRTGHVDQ